MRAIVVAPGSGEAELADVPEPAPAGGELLVESLVLGVCGTDREILEGSHGEPPPGRDRLVLGHESLGRVARAPAGSGFSAGDLVVGIVRRPDPVPCPCCAAGEWDMCRNGRYTERGIKELDGFGAERFALEPEFAVRLDPSLADVGVLVEPASVVAKAWEHIDHIAARACTAARRLLVVGAGPIGLLAALLGRRRGLELHVADLVEAGPKPRLVEAMGGEYHVGSVAEACPDADVIVEASGAPSAVLEAMGNSAPNAVVCLTGVPGAGRRLEVDAGALSRGMVLDNDVVFGSVNANRRHYELAAAALAEADRDVLRAMITRRVGLDGWREAVEGEDDVKAVVEFA